MADLEKLKRNLEERGFAVSCFDTAEEAAAYLDAALWRARNIAAPKNAQRLGVQTPCAAKGDRCYDCKSPQRICRALVVYWEKPKSMDMEVVLVRQDLGY